MLDQQRFATRSEDQRQEIFIERYERLLAWALSLTNQHYASAEDLVQDAFIQFTRGRTSLETIANVDGYLRRMLRYMHLARVTRNTPQLSFDAISIVDYDSFNLGWQSVEIQQRMQAQEALGQICSYACIRKESSRAGGVLILRFFHEYLPSEIAKILGRTRHCVDEWQRVARSEAKLYLEDPRRLKFVGSKPFINRFRIDLSRSDLDLISELRRLIFASCQGSCLSAEELSEIYEIGLTEKLTTSGFGHIVSCRRCLDAINRLLGIPLLAERYQVETRSETKPPSDGSGGATTDLRTTLETRLRAVVEHKPQELRVLVNSELVGSFKVNSESSDVKLVGLDHVHCVQVLNEEDVTLLFLTAIVPAESHTNQCAQIDLSESRSLAAFLDGTTLSVSYNAKPAKQVTAADSLKLVPPVPVRSPVPLKTCERLQNSSEVHLRRFVGAIGSHVTEIIRRLILPSSRYSESSLPDVFPTTTFVNKPLLHRPEFVTVVVSLLLMVITALLWLHGNSSVNPRKLLDQAKFAEQARFRSNNVIHRVIDLQERVSVEGAMVSGRRIEIWEDASSGEREDRIYDADNRLIARKLQTGTGTVVANHHKVASQEAKTKDWLLSPEEIWALEPSARNFLALVGNSDVIAIEELRSSYAVTLADDRAIGSARLLNATLLLGREDLLTKEQIVVIERFGEIREYRFIETSVDSFSRKDIDPNVFAVEPTANFNPSDTSDRRSNSERSPERSSHTGASEELEIDVAYLLNRAKGDRNEQITLSRDAKGLLRVEGIVETTSRKAELLRDLAPVNNNPAVKIDIGAIAETLRQTGTNKTVVTLRRVMNTTDVIPVDRELREYLSRSRLVGDKKDGLDEVIRSFATRNVNRSYRALFHAIELKQLVDRFAHLDMRGVNPQSRAKLLEMVRGHGAGFEREWEELRREVHPVFFESEEGNYIDLEGQIRTNADLVRDTQRLHKLVLEIVEGIRHALTTSAESTNLSIKSRHFWSNVVHAKLLARRITEYAAQ